MLIRNGNSIKIDLNAVMRRIEADPNLFKDFEPETVKGIKKEITHFIYLLNIY